MFQVHRSISVVIPAFIDLVMGSMKIFFHCKMCSTSTAHLWHRKRQHTPRSEPTSHDVLSLFHILACLQSLTSFCLSRPFLQGCKLHFSDILKTACFYSFNNYLHKKNFLKNQNFYIVSLDHIKICFLVTF